MVLLFFISFIYSEKCILKVAGFLITVATVDAIHFELIPNARAQDYVHFILKNAAETSAEALPFIPRRE